MVSKSGKFRFRKNFDIGAPAAEEDERFLKNCFIDNGDIQLLLDCDNPKRLIIGRTGSGKTALLHRLKELEEHVIPVIPYDLSIEYISNSNIIRFFTDAGVKLELFYKLLWRHIFTVEVIREKYKIYSSEDQNRVWNVLVNLFAGNSRKKKALDFLKKHGGEFFQQIEERVKEATRRTEKELSASLSAVFGAEANISVNDNFSDEEKVQIRKLGQDVVNNVQIRDLNEMFGLLNEILDDEQQRFYIVLDGLDDAWVDDTIKLHLIRALIDTIREFQKVNFVKVIACLRTDLIERVFRLTRSAGLQEEKMQGLYLPLTWSKDQLISLLDTRINQMAKDAYTTATVIHKDVLPNRKGNKDNGLDYLLKRTANRPRDVISFFNACIKQAVDSPKINWPMLKKAEGEYSRGRLRALADEWIEDYPSLIEFVDLFKNMPSSFRLSDITEEQLQNWSLYYLTNDPAETCHLHVYVQEFFSGSLDASVFKVSMASILYRVGFLGVKLESFDSVQFATPESRSVSSSNLSEDTICEIHPMYWRVLGIHGDTA